LIEVRLVDAADAAEVLLQVLDESFRQDGEAILGALCVADQDLVLGEVEILEAQADTLVEAQPAAVEESSHEAACPVHAIQDAEDFLLAQYGGKAFGSPGAHVFEREVEGCVQDSLVQEGDGVESLVLGGGSDVFLDRKVGEEGFDLGLAHAGGVLELVEAYEAADPVQVDLLGAVGIVLEPESIPDLVEEPGRRANHWLPILVVVLGKRVYSG
jgi:hypothetical protein